MKYTGHEEALARNGLALKKLGMKWKNCKTWSDKHSSGLASLDLADCFGIGIIQARKKLGMKRHWQEMVWH